MNNELQLILTIKENISHYNFIFMQDRQFKEFEFSQLNCDDVSGQNSPKHQNRNTTPIILEKCNFIGEFQYVNLFHILQKAYSTRTHNENRFINDFIKKNTALKELYDINGKQFCKGVMRTALIEEYGRFEIVKEKHSEANMVYIILEGKVASIKNDDETDMVQHLKQREVYQILMNSSRKEVKKINKLVRKFSSWRGESDRNYHEKYGGRKTQQHFLEFFQKGQTFGDRMKCFNNYFTHTFITMETSLILSIDIKNVIFWLNHAFQLKLQRLYKVLKNHAFFQHLDNEVLQEVISYMSVHRNKKNEFIYEQGQQSSYIYFLEQGQIKIQKQSHLFVDNPNQLYIDRRKLMNQREINNKQYLPYANFEQLYNYRPVQKTIQLGILTPFCVFGQEEIIQNKKRETSIRCSSLRSVYYRIELKRIYQILNDSITVFLTAIKTSIKEKIKYRQETYATAMNLENKNNLKYFYLQGEQTMPTPRKYIIKKINDRMGHCRRSIDKFKDNSSFVSQSTNDRDQLNPQLRNKIQNFDKSIEGSIPPYYNTFNFHKMMKTKLVKQPQQVKFDQEQSQQERIDTTEFKLKFQEQIKRESKIVAESHTWRLVKEKVRQENKLSKKIGSYKHDINFTTPLIDNKYFQNIETEMKRIQREKKTGKFNVSLPKKKRAQSLNTIMIS